MNSLVAGLKPLRRRLIAVRALESGLAGALAGAVAGAVLTLVRILSPQVLPLWAAHPAMPLVLVPFGFIDLFVIRLLEGATLRDAALAADRAGNLKERLATALEVLKGGRPGLLDGLLLDQAQETADRLDPRRLPLATRLDRRAKAVLLAILVLAAAAFVPPLAGPPLEARAAERAAIALENVTRNGTIAPTIRRAVGRTIAGLREAGARQGDAQQGTLAVYRAVAEADRARRSTLRAVGEIDDPDIRRLARAASAGDGPGAADAAAGLADRLAADAASGGMPPEARRRLADRLSGTAATAGQAELPGLHRDLAAAAEALRKGDPNPGEVLDRLAAALTDAFGKERSGGVAAVVAAVGQARRTLGLAESVPPAVAKAVSGDAELAQGSPTVAGPDGAAVGTGGARIPAAVRPEDRDVVQRYFGG